VNRAGNREEMRQKENSGIIRKGKVSGYYDGTKAGFRAKRITGGTKSAENIDQALCISFGNKKKKKGMVIAVRTNDSLS